MKSATQTPPNPSVDKDVSAPAPKDGAFGAAPTRRATVEPQRTGPKRHETGITAVAGIQTLLGGVMAIMAVSASPPADPSLTGMAANLLPPALLIVSGVGLFRRTGWGWWSACALFYFGWIQAFVAVAYGLGGFGAESFGSASSLLAVFTLILIYLNKESVMAVVHAPADTQPMLRSRVTPATAGFLLALLISMPHAFGH